MAVFAEEGEVRGYDLPEADITDQPALQPIVAAMSPDLIVNAAAYTDVEAAEDHLEAAFLANESGARNVAELAADQEAPVIYFSTDYVFDGAKGRPYTPDDPLAPIAVYGRSKAAGEAATRNANPRFFVLRTAWLYGPGGNNFVEKILRAAAERSELKVVEDETGSPTYTRDLAEAARALARTQAYGTYHAVNSGQCSRYAFAKEILRLAGIDIPVLPCLSSAYPTKAQRPAYSVLDTAALTQACGYRMRPWREALADYMQRRGEWIVGSG